MNSPLVSIIIPTHNRAALLERALRSALAQTYLNLEIVVVDDGSSDDTPERLKELCDRRCRVVRFDECRGVAAARNVAVGLARGQFISFLDDDDEYPLDRTAVLVDRLAKAPPEVAFAYAKALIVVDEKPSHVYPGIGRAGDIFRSYLGGQRFMTGSTLIRRAAMLPFDEALPAFEFSDLYLRILQRHQALFVDVVSVVNHNDTRRPRMSTDTEAISRAFRLQEERFLRGESRALRAGFWTSAGFFALRGGRRNRLASTCFLRAFTLAPSPWNFVRFVASLLGPAAVERYQRAADSLRGVGSALPSTSGGSSSTS